MKFLILLSAAMIGILPSLSHSATIVEGVDYADAPSAVVGSFGPGSHTISGTLSGTCMGTDPISCLFGSDPQDFLTFSITPGARLVEMGFTLSTSADVTDALGISFTYGSDLEGFAFSNLTPGAYDLIGITPVGGDISLILAGDEALSSIDYTADWTIDLRVTAVPLPGSGLLLGVGVIGLGALGRRRRGAKLT